MIYFITCPGANAVKIGFVSLAGPLLDHISPLAQPVRPPRGWHSQLRAVA
jgi:hypothetical protein